MKLSEIFPFKSNLTKKQEEFDKIKKINHYMNLRMMRIYYKNGKQKELHYLSKSAIYFYNTHKNYKKIDRSIWKK